MFVLVLFNYLACTVGRCGMCSIRQRDSGRECEKRLFLFILVLPSSQIDVPVPVSPAVMCRMAAGSRASGHTGSAVGAEVGSSE